LFVYSSKVYLKTGPIGLERGREQTGILT